MLLLAKDAKGCQSIAGSWERVREQIHPEPLEGTNPANTLILDFLPPALRDHRFLLFKLLRLWSCVQAAPANS